MVNLINNTMKSKYDANHTRNVIWGFLHKVPFLRNSWNDERIQKVIQDQALRFLGDGEAEVSAQIKTWKTLEGIDAR